MPDAKRVRLSPLYTPEFVVSPVVEWLHAMDLVALADDWGEGFAAWVYETRAALTEREYADLVTANETVSWSRLLARLYPDGELAVSFADAVRDMQALDAKAFREIARQTLAREERVSASREAKPTGRESPAKLKDTYVRGAEGFLEKHLRARWEEDEAALNEEVRARSERVWPATLEAWIETLTGRGVTLDPQFEVAKRFIAVPTRLLGPFVTLSFLETDPTSVLLVYGRTASSPRSGFLASPTACAAAGFRALGDETRLRILQLTAEREMYAHEIGTHFSHVGQPAVSRHLRYLAGLGLLTTRSTQAKTYYSLHRASVRSLAAQLEELASRKGEPSRRKAS